MGFAQMLPLQPDQGRSGKSDPTLPRLPCDQVGDKSRRSQEQNRTQPPVSAGGAGEELLKQTLNQSQRFGSIVGHSPAMLQVYALIMKVAQSNSSVVIYGESGTGKELVARTIHDLSSRHKERFVPINCGAIPSDLVESEFFGYKKGAFTGAAADKPGFLDYADNGTLFMDEVGELDMNMQAKLLRAIDGGGYTPVGSQNLRKPNIRIVAATNNDLKENVLNKKMREDFFYRLHILPVYLPSLRHRKEDIQLLIEHFLNIYSEDGRPVKMPPHILQQMIEYPWPGNVRELQNTIRRYLTINEVDFVNLASPAGQQPFDICEALDFGSRQEGRDLQAVLQDAEKAYIRHILASNGWHRGKTASILGINRKTLYKKMNQYLLETNRR